MNPSDRVAYWEAQITSLKASLGKHDADLVASLRQEPANTYVQGYELDVRDSYADLINHNLRREQLLCALEKAEEELRAARMDLGNSPAGEAGVASLFSSATFESDGKQIGSRSTTPEASAEQQSVRSKDDTQSKAGQDDRSAYVDDRNDDGGSLAGLQAKVNDLKVVLEGLKAQWQAFEASGEDETDSYLGTAGFGFGMEQTLDDLAQREEDLRAAQRAAGVPLSSKTVAKDYLPSFTMEEPVMNVTVNTCLI
ncbi:hypothetical protein NCC49_005300 [Naganishia albida]|nr:hypothetical protein NCC49_005300 [Naganishia albida]